MSGDGTNIEKCKQSRDEGRIQNIKHKKYSKQMIINQ